MIRRSALSMIFAVLASASTQARAPADMVRIGAMRSIPTDDPLFGGTVRADGRKLHPMYPFQVKSPAQSKGDRDVYTLVATIPADQAFRPLGEGGRPLAAER